jgi:hypothetical protein
MLKKFFYVLLPLLALLGPIGIHHASAWWPKIKDSISSLTHREEKAAELPPIPALPPRDESVTSPPRSSPPEGVITRDLDAIFRFDLTPGQIVGRWPCVMTGLSQLDLQGYRVPLVTGTAESDLAGALTYYFDARQQVQRITFHGTTGDAGNLVQFLTARYRFGRRVTNNPAIIRYEMAEPKGPAKNILDVRMVQPTDNHRRFELSLVLQRPQA